jgi:hypothetical protein
VSVRKGELMKLTVIRYMYEPPALAIIPETEYEAAVLSRYWEGAELSKGKATGENNSADGFSYGIKFKEAPCSKP